MVFVSLSSSFLIPDVPSTVEGIELRLDLFSQQELNQLRKSLPLSPTALMLTLRSVEQGGRFSGTLQEKMTWIEAFCKLSPDFMDVEWPVPKQFLSHLLQTYPKVEFILSHHATDVPIEQLEILYAQMSELPAHRYKIAIHASSTTDALHILLFSKKHPKLTAIAMGEIGSFTRVIQATYPGKLSFACLSTQATAPGQLSIQDLIHIYRIPDLKDPVALYGLIGSPVSHSIGHLYHNQRFAESGHNALYVKMCVTEEELPRFFPLAWQLNIKGLSVTTPLKEKVLPYIDLLGEEVHSIQAANTLLFQEENILGRNVDGIGAIDAIEKRMRVAGKRLVILGSGGAAAAIAYEATKRGADVHIANRNLPKAQKLSFSLYCSFSSLQEIPSNYDIIINATVHGMPIEKKDLLPGSLAMDITYHPKKTLFLQEAEKAGCSILYGEEMFALQANEQFLLWHTTSETLCGK